jgi:hypothetical protein
MYSSIFKTIDASQPSFRDRASTSAAVQPRPEIIRFDTIAAAVLRLFFFCLGSLLSPIYIHEMQAFHLLVTWKGNQYTEISPEYMFTTERPESNV